MCPCPEYVDEARTPCTLSRLTATASVLFLPVHGQPEMTGHHLALVKPLYPGSDTKTKLREILQLAEDLLHRTHAQGSPPTAATERSEFGLSGREWQVVRGLMAGGRLADVASTLGISIHTARNHLKSIFRKMHVQSQNELMRLVMESGHTEG